MMNSCDRILDDNKPMIALTFDDGPSIYDRFILSALEKAGGRATFFVLGRKVNKSGRLNGIMKRMLEDGCEIGNHSWNHLHLDRLSAEEIRDEIIRTGNVIRQAVGQEPALVRPPYGETGGLVRPVLAEMGFAPVLWSVDTLDWKTKNAVNTLSVVLHNAEDGYIFLMHSIIRSTGLAAALMIPELTRRGFQLVTVSELARARGGMTPGKEVIVFPPAGEKRK